MPIIPHYNLSQTVTHVYINVNVPHVRVSPKTLELIVDESEVHLYAPPTYLLKLVLPDKVVDENLYERSLDPITNNPGLVIKAESCKLVQDISDGYQISDNAASAAATAQAEDASSVAVQYSEGDLPKMQYDPLQKHGTIIITLRKVIEGLWEDLDLLGRLQRPLLKESNTNLITCVENDAHSLDHYDSKDIISDEMKSIYKGSLKYGLFQTYYNVFTDYAREGLVNEMLECPNPDEPRNHDEDRCTENRRKMRLDTENSKFDSERYLGDAQLKDGDDIIYDIAIAMKPHWVDTATNSDVNNTSSSLKSFFTQEESHALANLKPIAIPSLHAEQEQSILLTLSDILFAYVYDHRTTDGEPTVESSWTVMIISPTLSWLESYNAPYDSIVDVMKWCCRRSLIYPYLRNYSLALRATHDVSSILVGGRRMVLRCLLQTRTILEKSESHYLFNKLYIDPMIWWVQSCEEEIFRKFGREMQKMLLLETSTEMSWANDESNYLAKQHLDLGLGELEQAFFDGEDESSSDDSSFDGSDSPGDASEPHSDSGEVETIVQLIRSLDVNATLGEAVD